MRFYLACRTVYLQALYFPYLGRKFGFAAGTGLSIPTATDERLGTGKYLTTTPLLVWRVRRKWWVQFDTEAKTNFEASGHTSFKSGFLMGRVMKGQVGVWVKPEINWGRYREGDFVIKTSFFKVRTRGDGKNRTPSSPPK